MFQHLSREKKNSSNHINSTNNDINRIPIVVTNSSIALFISMTLGYFLKFFLLISMQSDSKKNQKQHHIRRNMIIRYLSFSISLGRYMSACLEDLSCHTQGYSMSINITFLLFRYFGQIFKDIENVTHTQKK